MGDLIFDEKSIPADVFGHVRQFRQVPDIYFSARNDTDGIFHRKHLSLFFTDMIYPFFDHPQGHDGTRQGSRTPNQQPGQLPDPFR